MPPATVSMSVAYGSAHIGATNSASSKEIICEQAGNLAQVQKVKIHMSSHSRLSSLCPNRQYGIVAVLDVINTRRAAYLGTVRFCFAPYRFLLDRAAGMDQTSNATALQRRWRWSTQLAPRHA